jgi:peptidoglycan/xylan/chitin deacetylase (PgdA/CDA1 family)
MFAGKRELIAAGLYWTGLSSMLNRLSPLDSLLVLNYHRIGNPETDPFDPGVFSATANEFDEQIAYLKRTVSLVTLEEAQSFIDGTNAGKSPRCRALITFDDGYLDNYDIAFPILKSHQVPAVFFLATDLIGSCAVPWWDHIAFLLKTARRHSFTLRYPSELTVDLSAGGVGRSLDGVLSLFKRPENTDPARFLRELQEAAQADEPPTGVRRFLNWDEARTMIQAGMAIGSHTHSHAVLSQLTEEQQLHELVHSRTILKRDLGIAADALAYPVGSTTAFTETTKSVAKQAGYRTAFSFYGGINLPGANVPYDVKRVSIGGQSKVRFRVQTSTCRLSGRYWP